MQFYSFIFVIISSILSGGVMTNIVFRLIMDIDTNDNDMSNIDNQGDGDDSNININANNVKII